MEKPFTDELQDFLNEHVTSINFAEISEEYRRFDEEIHKLHELIIPLLSEKGCSFLANLDDQCCLQMGLAAKITYQKGFSDGIKLILFIRSI